MNKTILQSTGREEARMAFVRIMFRNINFFFNINQFMKIVSDYKWNLPKNSCSPYNAFTSLRVKEDKKDNYIFGFVFYLSRNSPSLWSPHVQIKWMLCINKTSCRQYFSYRFYLHQSIQIFIPSHLSFFHLLLFTFSYVCSLRSNFIPRNSSYRFTFTLSFFLFPSSFIFIFFS